MLCVNGEWTTPESDQGDERSSGASVKGRDANDMQTRASSSPAKEYGNKTKVVVRAIGDWADYQKLQSVVYLATSFSGTKDKHSAFCFFVGLGGEP